jgi:hypothetical protein
MYDDGNPAPGLGQTQTCGRVKPVIEICYGMVLKLYKIKDFFV